MFPALWSVLCGLYPCHPLQWGQAGGGPKFSFHTEQLLGSLGGVSGLGDSHALE